MQTKKRYLLENSIQFWSCKLDQKKPYLPAYEQLLSTDEKLRASKFKFEKDRHCYIISRGILRKLLSSYLSVPAKDLVFDYTAFGKPYLPSEESLKFNLSHSANMAAFAFAQDHEIGVDIEAVKANFDPVELAGNFFSKKEITELNKQPEADVSRAFFRCWTRKEAFIKAEGSGLSFPLDQFAVSMHDDLEAELLETQWNPLEKEQWSLFSFQPAPRYIAAVASKHKPLEITYHNCDSV